MKFILVHNPHSGSSLPLSTLRKVFKKHGHEITTAIDITSEFPDKLTPLVKKGVYVVAYGGDGTQNAVASQLLGTDAVMVPLSGGTLNNFTKDLGVPQDLDEACARLHSLKTRKIDIGTVNDKVFVNNSSIGFYPSSLRVREAIGSRVGKWPAAAFGVIHALAKFKLYTVTMTGETFKTPFIFIGNNDYPLTGGGRRPSLTTGQLCAYAITATNRRTLVKLVFSALRGTLADQDEFIIHHDKEITIKTRRSKVNISTDGEVGRSNTPLTYRCEAKQLHVLA